LSHSYRGGDAELNRKLWSVFADNDFSFLVDARSDYFSLLYLETMMRRSHCFVAVVPARTEPPGYSRYIKFECDMARLARKPRFVVRSADASASAFSILSRDMEQEFDRSVPDNSLPELERKVGDFRSRVAARGMQVVSRSHHLGVLLASGQIKPASFDELSERLREVGGKHNYEVDVLDPERLDYGRLASLDRYDLLVIDVSGRYVPEDLFAFAHSRLIPSIKLVPLMENEFPNTVKLPLVSAKLRATATDPMLYWRNPEELLLAVDRELKELERLYATEDRQHAKTTDDAARYFGSLGRARLRVFLSNASEDGELALTVAEALDARYIDHFHYKDPRELRAGVDWRLQLAREVSQECGIFVMLVSEHYWSSTFCVQEFEAAKSRYTRGEMVILPFQIGPARVDRLEGINSPDMTQRRYRDFDRRRLAAEIADLIAEDMNLEGRLKDRLVGAERITTLHAEAIEMQPEAVIGGNDESLPFRWLLDALQACRSVARVRVDGVRNGTPIASREGQRFWYGTGWLIDEGILITNYHVVAGTDPDGCAAEDFERQARGMTARFGFTERRGVTRQFRVDQVLVANQALDYVVVRLHRFADDRQPGLEDAQLHERDPVSTIEFWGRLDLHPASALGHGDRLNIVQHPGGDQMMVAFRHNTVGQLSSDGRLIEYSTDTREGSSGSPVFDDEWLVRALHSHAVMVSAPGGTGRKAKANAGIAIETIMDDLTRHGLTIAMRRQGVRPPEVETKPARDG
jgi:V8-like Glu-specific endopeptidase